MTAANSPFYVIMGVSGSGKSTVGRRLAEALDAPFFDADDFHAPENVAKMARGIPLTDADREPWLARLAELIQTHLDANQTAVLACSALKQKYRLLLRVDPRVQFVYLQGDFDLIWQRMSERPGHYMKADMLHSQFAALEAPDPEEAIVVNIDTDVESIVEQVLAAARPVAPNQVTGEHHGTTS